ncbi:hypothetical protein [Streptomyces peucetius]|uniref:Secreted protein n=1 Tax=Streptomyces peucetius TaxID=1950 RepID=A0ABY6I0X6_STRPE|nr:hypothetical protein [Streptomyces peucetius]UYQ60627.1 hypothetical protein OGH68_03510 [Streptomyces peucetius]
MVTASPFRVSRARSSAGPLRLVWVALTLFAFLYAHGVSMEGVSGHLDSTATLSAAAETHRTAAPGVPPMQHHGGEHGPDHVVQECVPGQPQQTPVLDAPMASALVAEAAPLVSRPAACGFGDAASARPLPSATIRATILQI